jgi:hypothetical protein
MPRGRWIGAVWLLLVVMLAQTACRVGPFGSAQVTIQGVVDGEQASAIEQGKVVLVGIAQATVTCNAQQTTTAQDGSYALTVDQANKYACTVTGPSLYESTAVSVAGGADAHLTLNFTGATQGSCSSGSATVVTCARLALVPGTLSGRVVFADSGQGVNAAQVQCRDLADPAAQGHSVNSDANGVYELSGLPPGSYWCLATAGEGQVQAKRASVDPANTTSLNFVVCQDSCPRVTYHAGEVMHSYRAYVIFWLPAGDRFEPAGSDGRYESLVERYFGDVGGTSFYDLLTQYYDFAGPALNEASLAATYVDRTPYQHCVVYPGPCTRAAASRSDPLLDEDIEAEVDRVSAAKGWKPDANTEVMVLTSSGAQACDGDAAASGVPCTFLQDDAAVCGWHNFYLDPTGAGIEYALIADPLISSGLCLFGNGGVPPSVPSPNGDWVADTAISTISHEQLESVSDPQLGGWYVTSLRGPQGEIGDLCEGAFPNLRPDNSDVTLQHGDRYIVQAEWSDAADGCALSL